MTGSIQRQAVIGFAILFVGAFRLLAQLAVTEVMSEASRECGSFRGSDFWELTNYGTNTIDLDGYQMHDDHFNELHTNVFSGLAIGPGESIVFVRTNRNIPTVSAFVDWWGPSLPPGTQISAYSLPGLNGDDAGDELWVRDSSGAVVDRVFFFRHAEDGQSFINDPVSAEFGLISQPETNCAWRAAMCAADIGSPGCTTPSVPLAIVQQPANQSLPGCGKVTLSVGARGLPRPKYQWYEDGMKLEGATESTLILHTLAQSHQYHVVLNNGLTETTSNPAIVTVGTTPIPPAVAAAPGDVVLFPGQTGVFCVEAVGSPCVSYQWQLDGADLPGENGRCVEVSVPFGTPGVSRVVNVRVFNQLGATNVAARLTVTRRPQLAFTEVMPWPTNDALTVHKDWVELTNYDTEPIDLRGYRLSDTTNFGPAFTIRDPVVIQPGESIILVEQMPVEEFRRWWGEEHLPPGLQIVRWGGFAVDNMGGDDLYLYNPAARDVNDYVSSLSVGNATEGLSYEFMFVFCDDAGCGSFGNEPSIVAQGGAFMSVEAGDVGSPGYLENPPPRMLAVERTGSEAQVRCRIIPGFDYRLLVKNNLGAGQWSSVETKTATAFFLSFRDPGAGGPLRFYSVEQLR